MTIRITKLNSDNEETAVGEGWTIEEAIEDMDLREELLKIPDVRLIKHLLRRFKVKATSNLKENGGPTFRLQEGERLLDFDFDKEGRLNRLYIANQEDAIFFKPVDGKDQK